jgi:type VI protein secretion system component VasA
MQCACAILSSVGCTDVPHFSTLSHKRQDFFLGGGNSTQNVCFDLLYKCCVKYLILRRTERDMLKNEHRSSCKVPVIIVRF